MFRPTDLPIIPHMLYQSPTTNRVADIPLVTPDQVVTRLRRAKDTARNPLLIIADLRETRLYQVGHVITALSTNCYTKTMAKRAIGLWDSVFSRCNGCPSKNSENQTFRDQQLQTKSTCVVVYDQLGDYLPNEMSVDSPIYFFLSHLLERGNSVLFMVGGFNAFQSLRSRDFIDSGSPVAATTTCQQQHSPATGRMLGRRAANLSPYALTAVRSSPPCSRGDLQSKQGFAYDTTSGLNLLTLVSRSMGATQKRTTSRLERYADRRDGCDPPIDDVLNARVSKILPFLYLGNARDAQDLDLLCRLSVTHIVNVTDCVPMPFTSCSTSPPFVYLHLPASDTNQQDLRPAFERAVKFISDASKHRGVVLVHCKAGVSRSVAVVMAYLLHTNPRLSVLEALEFVQNRRSVAGPNLHFMGQLQRYRNELDQRPGSTPYPRSSSSLREQSALASISDTVVDSLFADIDFQFEA